MKLTEPLLKGTSITNSTNFKHLRRHFKVVRVPALRDKVQNKNPRNASAPCVNELSRMMDCWKLNDFNESNCSDEIKVFNNCIALAKKEEAEGGHTGRLYPSKEVNKMLARFPQRDTNCK